MLRKNKGLGACSYESVLGSALASQQNNAKANVGEFVLMTSRSGMLAEGARQTQMSLSIVAMFPSVADAICSGFPPLGFTVCSHTKESTSCDGVGKTCPKT